MGLEPVAPNAVVRVDSVGIGNRLPLAIIAGPCALESRDHALEMAAAADFRLASDGASFALPESAAAGVLDNLRRLEQGLPLRNLVDRARGY